MRRKSGLLCGAVLLAAFAAAGRADADTRQATLSVKVEVVSACGIAGSSLEFGTYTSGQAAALDGQASIAYSDCGPGTITVELDGGQAGSTAARRLRNGSSALAYNLYRNTARNQIWGTGTEAKSASLTSATSNAFIVYGRIAGGQAAGSGTYTDTVNITMTF